MTTDFKRVRNLPFQPSPREIADIVNQLTKYAHQDQGPQKVGVLAAVTASTYTVTDNDYFIPVNTTSNNVTITLPPKASNDGRVLKFKRITGGNNVAILDGDSTDTIDGATTLTIYQQYMGYELTCDASTGWYITGVMSG